MISRIFTSSAQSSKQDTRYKPTLGTKLIHQLQKWTMDDYTNNLLSKIYVACHTLAISTEARWTAFVLFYRCLNVHSKSSSNTSTCHSNPGDNRKQRLANLASASVFLACKLSNETRRIRDVINVHQMLSFDDTADTTVIHLQDQPPLLDETYWETKAHVVKHEQDLLRIIGFNVTIEFPHRIVVAIWEELVQGQFVQCSKETSYSIIQSCWKYLNDVMFSSICTTSLRASALGCALLSLALEEHGLNDTENLEGLNWYEWVDVTRHEFHHAVNVVSKTKT